LQPPNEHCHPWPATLHGDSGIAVLALLRAVCRWISTTTKTTTTATATTTTGGGGRVIQQGQPDQKMSMHSGRQQSRISSHI